MIIISCDTAWFVWLSLACAETRRQPVQESTEQQSSRGRKFRLARASVTAFCGRKSLNRTAPHRSRLLLLTLLSCLFDTLPIITRKTFIVFLSEST